MKIFGKELSCDKCGVPCGGIDEPGLYKIGDRWLCKRHYEAVKEYERVRAHQDRLSTSGQTDEVVE